MKAYRHILLVTGLLLTFFAFVPQARGEGWEHHDTVPAAEAPDAGVIGDADATAAEEVAAENKAEEAVDVKGIVFGHIGDSYDWHITTWGKTHITVPLPVIVRGENGRWHLFSSSRVAHGQSYEGFYIAQGGDYDGKIVERNAAGEEVRPIDLSLTKTAFALLFNSALLMLIVLGAARWYKRHPVRTSAPGGFVGLMEAAVMMIHDDLIKSCVGKDYKRFAPYLLTVFFFIFVNNLMGLIPFFPGGANVSGNIAVTLVLALCTFLAVNLFGTREYWKEIFWPKVPIYLKLPLPIMPFVEFFGVFTKPFALMIRLFANIMAGHTIILALTCLIFITVSMGMIVNLGMTAVSVLFCVFMNCLELFVACLQAYIFTLLSANYIGLAKVKE